MSHSEISYKGRLTPKFDAVNDIKEWLGDERWDKISPEMANTKNVEQFSLLCSFMGVAGFPVEAWYDLYWGEGEYKKAWELVEAEAGAD